MTDITWEDTIGDLILYNYVSCVHASFPGVLFISVGSGRGYHEADLMECIRDLEIICVDPNPTSWTKEIAQKKGIEPKYRTVDDLLLDRPELKGNCHLLLIWPYVDKTTYDIAAIKSLNPITVVSIHDASGRSGGTAYLAWVKMVQTLNETRKKLLSDDLVLWKDLLPESEYIQVARCVTTVQMKFRNKHIMDRFYDQIVILVRNDMKSKMDTDEVETGEKTKIYDYATHLLIKEEEKKE